MLAPQEQPEVKVRVTSSSRSRFGENEINISGLTDKERETVEGMILGNLWVRVRKGRIQSTRRYKKPPTPVEDPVMEPFWPTEPSVKTQMSLVNINKMDQHNFTAAITIQHLCGYYHTPQKYQIEAEKLRKLGFICLRSRRARDGKYYELWYLPYLEAAKGPLKKIVDRGRSNKKFARRLSAMIRYLARNCSFGTCDVSVQRLAMVMAD